ncbi:MAG: hypothetical protein OJF51_003971 [Nitrospira sp.]|nr:MAG: hypothetical protein OJF51_003971 [Nitrospira sp.]
MDAFGMAVLFTELFRKQTGDGGPKRLMPIADETVTRYCDSI